ncbi:MAG TPA: hypothetical protein VI479_20915 [Blastocatellia bacterium]
MIFTYLPLLAPLSPILAWLHAPSPWVFITAVAAVVPLAEWVRRATEQLARRAGAVIALMIPAHFDYTELSNPLELIAITAVAFAVNSIAQDGETTRFDELLLVAVYALLALAFFFVTPPKG